MKRNLFIVELVKSPPFLIFIILALLITIGVVLAGRREKAVKMKEDILYIAPKPNQ
jgi:hypothetical protein